MSDTKKALFSFETFKIKSFSLSEADSPTDKISVEFKPSGKFNITTKNFYLELGFKAFQKDDNREIITAVMIATFNIPDAKTLEEIPTFFYRNSIAVIYPYLRSFITTLTIQANTKPLIMPLLNLSQLENPLKDATTVIEE